MELYLHSPIRFHGVVLSLIKIICVHPKNIKLVVSHLVRSCIPPSTRRNVYSRELCLKMTTKRYVTFGGETGVTQIKMKEI
jgi:hypothetical protein